MTHSDYIELVNTIKSHDYRYWTLNDPVITDEEYDVLFGELQLAESEHPEWILPDSPTQVISTATNGNNRRLVRRRTIMLSTEKANSVDKLVKWMFKTAYKAKKLGCNLPDKFSVEWKYDGESCSLVYIDGNLVEASSGKGTDGIDILDHVQYVNNIPTHIPEKGRVEIRGEIVCLFANLPQTSYKTCRAAAIGYLANETPDPTVGRLMKFFPYQCIGECFDSETVHGRFIHIQQDFGFEEVAHNSNESIDYILNLAKECEQVRSQLEFPVDGLVIKVHHVDKWSDFGATDHHPKYSCAYKFPGVTAVTTLRSVEITVGEKTGKRTPVAHFDPIVMNGATYKQCSCGSEATFAEKNIKPGDRIIVTLANDVICQVVGRAD